MHTNGTASKPLAKLGEIALLKRPIATWSTALETCRKARGWGQGQLIAEALKGENVSVSDVKRWELAKANPTLNQCNKLRAALPELAAYDDLLRLELRARPSAKNKAPLPSVKPEGWPGPSVRHFGEALKWARTTHGMSQAELSRMIGIVTMAPWEREGYTMIRGAYEKLCEILPEMRFAPQPKFSAKYQNQFRSKGYLQSQELHQEAARAQKVLAQEEAPARPVAPPHHAPLNTSGANYGVLRAAALALEAELERLTKRHDDEKFALMQKIERAKTEAKEAEEHMINAARTMHVGAP